MSSLYFLERALEIVPSPFELVVLACLRERSLLKGVPCRLDVPKMARFRSLQEIQTGMIGYDELYENAIQEYCVYTAADAEDELKIFKSTI